MQLQATFDKSTPGMHNFFEAKGRKLEACRAESGGRVLRRGIKPPPHQLLGGLGSAISSLVANAYWCILSSKIASGGNFFDYLFQLKK